MESLKNLSLEKQASAAVFLQQIKKMSREQAIDLLGKMYIQQLIREDEYNAILRKAWGIAETTSQTPRL